MVALGYQFEKGYGVNQDAGRAFQLYEHAAGLGSPDGMFNLFRLYTTGKGVTADPRKARAWLEKAAAAGSAEAQKELAVIARGTYEAPGRDLAAAAFAAYGKKDYATSVGLYRQAAELGNTDAAVALGQHYAQGLGVARDLQEALSSPASPRKRATLLARPSLAVPMKMARVCRRTGPKCAAGARKPSPSTIPSGSTAWAGCINSAWRCR